MGLKIRATYDGRVLVPEEPLDLAPGQALELEVHLLPAEPWGAVTPEERKRRVHEFAGSLDGIAITPDMLARESYYEDPSA